MLVPRRRRLEVNERIDAQGEIVTALDEAEMDTLVDSIRSFGEVQAVAVCLMFSFLNDVHERRIGERLRSALPEVVRQAGDLIAYLRNWVMDLDSADLGFDIPFVDEEVLLASIKALPETIGPS